METTLNNKFFDFEKAKVQTLSLDQLARTHKENDIYGKPLRGIYHYDLLNQIIGMCNAQNYDVEVYDLFAAQNKDRNTPGVVLLPQVEAQYGERAVEAHILRRVFATFASRISMMQIIRPILPSHFIRKEYRSDSAIW